MRTSDIVRDGSVRDGVVRNDIVRHGGQAASGAHP